MATSQYRKTQKLLIHENHDAGCNRKVVAADLTGANQPPVNIDIVIGLTVCFECRELDFRGVTMIMGYVSKRRHPSFQSPDLIEAAGIVSQFVPGLL